MARGFGTHQHGGRVLSKRKAPADQGEGKNRTTSQQAEESVLEKHIDAGAGVNRHEKLQTIEHPLSAETLWVSVIGTCARFDEAAARWHVAIRRRGSAAIIQSFLVAATVGTLINLDELDISLLEHGWIRCSAWEMGSDDGWVAWLSSPANAGTSC